MDLAGCTLKSLHMGIAFIDVSIVDAKHFINPVTEVVAAIIGGNLNVFFMYKFIFVKIHKGTLLGKK
ncbi:hypothetical protein D3C86_2125130 [compost metagenome]